MSQVYPELLWAVLREELIGAYGYPYFMVRPEEPIRYYCRNRSSVDYAGLSRK